MQFLGKNIYRKQNLQKCEADPIKVRVGKTQERTPQTLEMKDA